MPAPLPCQLTATVSVPDGVLCSPFVCCDTRGVMVRRTHLDKIWIIQLLMDVLAICVAYFIAWVLIFHLESGARLFGWVRSFLGEGGRPGPGEMLRVFYLESAPRIIGLLALTICLLYGLLYLYSGSRYVRKRPWASQVILANGIALAIFYGYFYLSRNIFHPRSFFATFVLFNCIACISLRVLLDQFQRKLWKQGQSICRALLVGDNPGAQALDELISTESPSGMVIVGRGAVSPDDRRGGLVTMLTDRLEACQADVLLLADKELQATELSTELR